MRREHGRDVFAAGLASTSLLAVFGAGCLPVSPLARLTLEHRPRIGGGDFTPSFVVFSSTTDGLDDLIPGPGAGVNLSVTLALVEHPQLGVVQGPVPRVPASEIQADLTASRSFHQVRDKGGRSDLACTCLGARFATPRYYDPRLFFLGGWSFSMLDYEAAARADVRVSGPYFGSGIETFVTPTLSVGGEYRMHVLSGQDDSGNEVGATYHVAQFFLALNW